MGKRKLITNEDYNDGLYVPEWDPESDKYMYKDQIPECPKCSSEMEMRKQGKNRKYNLLICKCCKFTLQLDENGDVKQ